LQRQLLRVDECADRREDLLPTPNAAAASDAVPVEIRRRPPPVSVSADPAPLPSGVTLPDQLPSDLPDFTSRESEIAAIMDVLRPDLPEGSPAPWPVPLTVITGAGGMGKTALAVHVAHLLRPSYPGGCLFVSFAGQDDCEGLRCATLGRVLRALGVPPAAVPADHHEATVLYRSILSGRRMLLLIDDVRHPDQVTALVPGSADCAVVITSRCTLAGLDAAFRVTLGELSADQARTMIRGIVGASRTDHAAEAVGRLCALCDNLPLALRIAGTKLALRPGWRVADLVEDLSVNGWILDPDRSDDATVRLVLGLSLNRLPERDAGAFRLLAATSMRRFTVAVAAVLLDTDVPAARRTAERLVDVHLLASDARDHYHVRELQYQYARQELVRLEPHLLSDAVCRITHYYLDTLAGMTEMVTCPAAEARAHAAGDPGPYGADAIAAWLDAEYDNIHALAADNRLPRAGQPADADQLLGAVQSLTDTLAQAAAR
jgi:hypothetical protein